MQSTVGLTPYASVSLAKDKQRFGLSGHLQNYLSIVFLESTIRRGDMVANARPHHCNADR